MFEHWDSDHNNEFTIHGISSETMKLVLEFIYTRSVTLSRSNVQDLVLAADFFLLEDLVNLCSEFMERQLCPENCIGIWRFSDIVVLPTMRNLTWRYILSHFEEVMVCEEFLGLTTEELMSIIEPDELDVKNESVVLEAVVQWTNYALDERKDHFPQLLNKVRYINVQ